ncbi:hypothetical protein KI387_008517, partial [Taxus chinensis]
MGRPPVGRKASLPSNFTGKEVQEMEKVLEDVKGAILPCDTIHFLAKKFNISSERAGKSPVQSKQIKKWFEKRINEQKRKVIKHPGKLNVILSSHDDSVTKRAANDSTSVPSETLDDVVEGSVSDPEEEIQKDSSIYDTLLSSLKSSCASFAGVYNKRQREQEGVSSGEEEDSDPEVGSDAEVADVDMGAEEASEVEIVEAEEDEDINDVNGELGSDAEDSSKEDEEDKANNNASMTISSFKLHMEHILTEADVQKLKEGKRKFKSEVPAHRMPTCKWITTNDAFPKDDDRLESYGVKLRLQTQWQTIHKRAECGDFTSAMQSQFFSLCNSYQDILHSNKNAFMEGGQDDDSSVTDAYLLHLLDHVHRTRDLVTKNNARLSQQSVNDNKIINAAEPPRDQGFTRPKVLILLPLRSTALRTVKRLIELIPSSCKVNIEFRDRFFDEFGADEDDENEDLEDRATSEVLKQWKQKKSSKPADFQALFGGNNEDHFRFGIKFTKKTVKLYSDFYSSDIIVASPIGLITRIGEAETEKNKDVDFLSSIEILVIDNADVILMQNWSHIVSVVDQLNQLPTKQHGTDFMRIREWYLNGQARYYRQTIVLSNFVNADINALFNRFCVNYQGKVKLSAVYNGVLPKVLLQVRQIYERFDCSSVLDVDDKRFEFFVKKIFPKIKDSLQGGIMIFISSYFDFVRLRNFLKEQNASFCLLG